MSDSEEIQIIYDGNCPFCAAYVRMQRLQALAGSVELIDARGSHPVLKEIRDAGLDLNQGMALKLNGQLYYGADVINKLALLSGDSGTINRLWYWVFKEPGRAKALYPSMRAIRNLTLRVLGKPKIDW